MIDVLGTTSAAADSEGGSRARGLVAGRKAVFAEGIREGRRLGREEKDLLVGLGRLERGLVREVRRHDLVVQSGR